MDVSSTNTPPQEITPVKPDIDPSRWSQMSHALYEGLTITESQRSNLDKTLDYWNDMAEMAVAPRDDPWPNAASLCIPIVAMMMESVQSRLVSAVFVPRLYVVSPLTDIAVQFSAQTETWYNAEFRRRHWLRTHLDCLAFSLRDGVGVMEILWEKRIVERWVVTVDPVTKRKVRKKATIIDHNGVKLDAVELRDFFLLPATARSIQEAASVYRRLYLTEDQLWEMAEEDEDGNPGILDPEKVRELLEMHSVGQNDMQSDSQGTATYEQAGTLEVGDTGSMDPEGPDGKGTKSKGLFEVWRIHSNEYDMDGDGRTEENVFYLADINQEMIGWAPFEYWHGKRPFVKMAPMPRPNRFQGWSVPERLRSYQEEGNATHNQRKDAMDLKICPPTYELAGATLVTQGNAWGPKAHWKLTTKEDFGIIDIGTIDPASWQEESLLYRYAGAMVGIESPMMPLAGNQKVPAKQQMAGQQASNIRLDLMALEVRLACEEIFWHIAQLNLQYASDDMENELGGQGLTTLTPQQGSNVKKLSITEEALAQDYQYGIAGTEGALDQDTERQMSLTLYAMLMQNPLVQGNLKRVHALTSFVLEKYNLAEYTRFIGSPQDAETQQKAMADAQKKQHDEEMALQLASHSKNNSGGGGAKPAAPPTVQPPSGESNLQSPPGGSMIGATQ